MRNFVMKRQEKMKGKKDRDKKRGRGADTEALPAENKAAESA